MVLREALILGAIIYMYGIVTPVHAEMFTYNGTTLAIHRSPGDGDCLFRSIWEADRHRRGLPPRDTDAAVHAFRRRVVARVEAKVVADVDARVILLAELKTDARCHYYQKHGCVTQVYERDGCDDAALLAEYFRRMGAGPPREPPAAVVAADTRARAVPARAYYGGAPEIVAASAELGVAVLVCDPARGAARACFALRDDSPAGGVGAGAPQVYVVRRRGAEHYDAALPVACDAGDEACAAGGPPAAETEASGVPVDARSVRELRGGGGEDDGEGGEEESCAAEPLDGHRVLLLGGNGFMGAETVELLAEAGAEVWAANRGTEYWDYATRARPLLHHHGFCSRDDFAACARELPDAYFDAVVDFSGFQAAWVREAAAALEAKTRRGAGGADGVYVYISTDSVYEVCDTEAQGHAGVAYPAHARARAPTRRLVESDAVRPADARERRRLNDADGYGNDKLEGEEALAALARERGSGAGGALPHVSLRLPDVLGARDNGPRGPATMLGLLAWADHRDQDPEFEPELRAACPPTHDGVGLSAVWSRDVARAVLAVLRRFRAAARLRASGGGAAAAARMLDGVAGEAFNLAFDEAPELRQLLATWAGAMGLLVRADGGKGPVEPEPGTGGLYAAAALPCSRAGEGHANYPSTTRGPIDNAKAKARLGWAPSPLAVALRATARFYFDSEVAQAAVHAYFRQNGGAEKKRRRADAGGPPSEHAVQSWGRAVAQSAHALGFDPDGMAEWLQDKLRDLRRRPGFTVPGPRSPLEGDDAPRALHRENEN